MAWEAPYSFPPGKAGFNYSIIAIPLPIVAHRQRGEVYRPSNVADVPAGQRRQRLCLTFIAIAQLLPIGGGVEGSSQTVLFARGTRTIKQCSFNARS